MDVPPDRPWAELKRIYVDGSKFADQGYKVEQLADPAVWAGGVRVSRALPDRRMEERVARVIRLDEAARILALSVRYSAGITALASYEVRPRGTGSEFQPIAHAEQPIPLSAAEAAGRQQVVARVKAFAALEDKVQADAWAAEKARMVRAK
ncbi:MAG: hypothetical protein ACK5SX_07685 [Sandaracinobacter sp.]